MEFLIVMFGLICRKHAVMKDAPTKPLREWSAQDMVQNKLVMPNCIEYWEQPHLFEFQPHFIKDVLEPVDGHVGENMRLLIGNSSNLLSNVPTIFFPDPNNVIQVG